VPDKKVPPVAFNVAHVDLGTPRENNRQSAQLCKSYFRGAAQFLNDLEKAID